MGIYKFNKCMDTYINNAKQRLDPTLGRYQIVVDGTLMLYKGTSEHIMDPVNIAFLAADYLKSLVNDIKRTVTVDSVIVYADGYKPIKKTQTSNSRDHKRFDVHRASQLFKSQCENNGYDFRCLGRGEAEMEMIRQIDTSKPTVAITNDTDVYYIVYKKPCFKRPIYMARGKREDYVNLVDFDVHGMPRSIFGVLVLFIGTDYTQSFFTTTMATEFMRCYSIRDLHKELSYRFDIIDNLDLRESASWKDVLYHVYYILAYAKNELQSSMLTGRRGNFQNHKNAMTVTRREYNTCEELVVSLAWAFRYFELGRDVDKYSSNDTGFPKIEDTELFRIMYTAKNLRPTTPPSRVRDNESCTASPSVSPNKKGGGIAAANNGGGAATASGSTYSAANSSYKDNPLVSFSFANQQASSSNSTNSNLSNSNLSIAPTVDNIMETQEFRSDSPSILDGYTLMEC